MVMNVPLRGQQKEEFKNLLKPHSPIKTVGPKEKLGTSKERVLPIRGQ